MQGVKEMTNEYRIALTRTLIPLLWGSAVGLLMYWLFTTFSVNVILGGALAGLAIYLMVITFRFNLDQFRREKGTE